ncbi:MAG: hypothetical protein GEU81_16815 [Nitriliruptorales bacterium]|nr:hypothetical protein [Nitriliruptorales bacterium]
MAEALIAGGGELRATDWARALHRWLRTSPQGHLAGPTTREMLERWGQGAPERPKRRSAVLGATNGAAMRVAPAGLVRPGDIEGAVRLAWKTCEPTHDTQVAAAAAGAGAIAAGVAHALTPEADVFSVVQACRAGAVLGERIGISEGRRVPAPSVARRMDLAVNEVLRTASLDEAIAAVADTVGTGIMTAESVSAAVGLFLAAAGDPLEPAGDGRHRAHRAPGAGRPRPRCQRRLRLVRGGHHRPRRSRARRRGDGRHPRRRPDRAAAAATGA